MQEKKDFYIGWQENMPETQARFLKKRLVPVFILIPLLVFLFVVFQRPFNQHQFEFGNSTVISGTYVNHPFPMILDAASRENKNIGGDILLVGYGKFGARGIMDDIQSQSGDLNGKKIKITGTLIYGDGKTLMELTEEKASLIEIESTTSSTVPVLESLEQIVLNGEVLDPKCYFGVMKPGEGKIHKSCAIRCISGGIPPVFRSKTGNSDDSYDYYLMVDASGNSLNEQILPYVAEAVTVKAIVKKIADWKILYVDLSAITYPENS